MDIRKKNNWPEIGKNIIISEIGNLRNIQAVPITIIDDDSMLVALLNVSGQNTYIMTKNDKWKYSKETITEQKVIPREFETSPARNVKYSIDPGIIIINPMESSEPIWEKNIGISGQKEKYFLAKTDIYNPKYLEALVLNRNRYALTFKNLDLFSDIDVDKKLNEMAGIRLNYLKNKNLIGLIKECSDILDLRTNNPAELCLEYYTPMANEDNKIRILKKLQPSRKLPRPLSRAKHEIVVNNLHITMDNLITVEEYEIAEGAKLESWIENNLIYYGGTNILVQQVISMVFSDLIFLQNRGHIYLTKAGIDPKNIVDESLITLTHLKEQYAKPINDAELVKLIRKHGKDSIAVEAQKLLALEYFICLQPEPRYLLFILKRLVSAWYADFELIYTITKIRILINQYRGRRDKEDNLKFGVLPIILIYLRYGPVSFNMAISKINYYFTNYVYTGWTGNSPDYFTKLNDLIYYSNGSPDTKRFFEYLPEISRLNIYKKYMINPSSFFTYGKDIIAPYPQPYDIEKLKYKGKLETLIKVEEKKIR